MIQDEIIEMARESGLETQDGFSESVFYFAKLVAEREREKFCAVLRQLHDSYSLASDSNLVKAIAEAEKQDDELQKVHSALACAIWDRMQVEELLFKLTGVKLISKPNTPQQRTWVDLTDEESVEIQKISTCYEQAVELTKAKLKDKNT